MRKHHRSASPFEDAIGFSRAIRAGDRILVAGTAPIGPDGQTVEGDAYLQARRCFEIAPDRHRGAKKLSQLLTSDPEAVGRAHGVQRSPACGDRACPARSVPWSARATTIRINLLSEGRRPVSTATVSATIEARIIEATKSFSRSLPLDRLGELLGLHLVVQAC